MRWAAVGTGSARRCVLLLPLLLWWAGPLLAAPTVDELQRLDFGTLALPANDVVSAFVLPRGGSGTRIEGRFVWVAAGTPGRYRLSGFPADTQLEVTLDDAQLTLGGSGMPEVARASDFDTGVVRTNALGEAELLLGGRLSSSGNGGNYPDGAYRGTTTMRFDFWNPATQSYATVVHNLDVSATFSSTLQLAEVLELTFGTLFARATPDDQASLTLSPSGSFVISAPGGTRLVSLSAPSPAVIRVSGAAPHYPLQIQPQAGAVQLWRTSNPGSAPPFILESMVTSPSGTGTTDQNGELLIRVGGTLKTQLTATPQVYPSGIYQGTYELTVSY